jgi:hypothetical protein
MRSSLKTLSPLAFATLGFCASHFVEAADLPRPSVAAPRSADVPEWTFRFTPYGWLPSMNGTQTVRGRTAKVDASFIEVVEKSDSLVGLMGDVEIRNGPIALLGDIVWSKVGLSGDTVRTRSVAPGINATIGASAGIDVQMAIAEIAVAYEIARYGSLAFDVIGGGRFWWQNTDLLFNLAGTLDVGDLQIAGARAIFRSGSVDWADPLVGGRVRYEVAPGHSCPCVAMSAGSASAAISRGRPSPLTDGISRATTASPSQACLAIALSTSTTPRAVAGAATSSTCSSTGPSSGSARGSKPLSDWP